MNKQFLLLAFAILFLMSNVSASIILPDGDNYNITDCDTNIEGQGTFNIVNDLNDSVGINNACIEFPTDNPNIIINGNGHKISMNGGNVFLTGYSSLNLSVNNLTVEAGNGSVVLFYSEVGGAKIKLKDVNLINISQGMIVYPSEDLILNAENILVTGKAGIGSFVETDSLVNSVISNLTITMLENYDFAFLTVNDGINNLTLKNITFLDSAGRGKVEYKNSIPINVIGNFLLTEKDVRFYSNGISLMRDINNFTKGQLNNVPAIVTFTNLPSGNYYTYKDGTAIGSLYDPNTQTLTLNVDGAGNYSYNNYVPETNPLYESIIYQSLNSGGAGISKFLGYLTVPLAILFFLIAITFIIIELTIGLGNLLQRMGK